MRIARSGAGVVVPVAEVQPHSLHEAVTDVLSVPKYRDATESISRIMQSMAPAEETAAGILEEVLARI